MVVAGGAAAVAGAEGLVFADTLAVGTTAETIGATAELVDDVAVVPVASLRGVLSNSSV